MFCCFINAKRWLVIDLYWKMHKNDFHIDITENILYGFAFHRILQGLLMREMVVLMGQWVENGERINGWMTIDLPDNSLLSWLQVSILCVGLQLNKTSLCFQSNTVSKLLIKHLDSTFVIPKLENFLTLLSCLISCSSATETQMASQPRFHCSPNLKKQKTKTNKQTNKQKTTWIAYSKLLCNTHAFFPRLFWNVFCIYHVWESPLVSQTGWLQFSAQLMAGDWLRFWDPCNSYSVADTLRWLHFNSCDNLCVCTHVCMYIP